jgi:hypothetical protein
MKWKTMFRTDRANCIRAQDRIMEKAVGQKGKQIFFCQKPSHDQLENFFEKRKYILKIV